jgi:hypothetical protein
MARQIRAVVVVVVVAAVPPSPHSYSPVVVVVVVVVVAAAPPTPHSYSPLAPPTSWERHTTPYRSVEEWAVSPYPALAQCDTD